MWWFVVFVVVISLIKAGLNFGNLVFDEDFFESGSLSSEGRLLCGIKVAWAGAISAWGLFLLFC